MIGPDAISESIYFQVLPTHVPFSEDVPQVSSTTLMLLGRHGLCLSKPTWSKVTRIDPIHCPSLTLSESTRASVSQSQISVSERGAPYSNLLTRSGLVGASRPGTDPPQAFLKHRKRAMEQSHKQQDAETKAHWCPGREAVGLVGLFPPEFSMCPFTFHVIE